MPETAERMVALMADLDAATNLHGGLGLVARQRLYRCVEAPSVEAWEDAHAVILNRRTWRTLWQAVLAVDPTFPTTGRATDAHGAVVADWPRIPEPELVLDAIAHAVRES